MTQLSKIQKEIVEYNEGPIRIIAGPGSGKTKTLISKISFLVKEQKVEPWKILAITFTNKAASEMKNRLNESIGENNVKIMTYHGFCAYFLRLESENIGIDKNYKILDMTDQKQIVSKLQKKIEGIEKISFYKIIEMFDIYLHNNFRYSADEEKGSPYVELYKAYKKHKEETSSLDFNDLLVLTSQTLQANKEIAERWTNRFDYILVDEFQDTDDFQFNIVRNITTPTSNLTVVGDPDQNIYSWRGANINIILSLKNHYDNLKDFYLEENYRSTKAIVETSQNLIRYNKERFTDIDLFTNNEVGNLVSSIVFRSEDQEAKQVTRQIKEYINDGIQPNEIAVIYRTNKESSRFELELNSLQIPYKVVGGFRFFDRKEIKETLAFLDYIMNPLDVYFEEIINIPSRGIGPKKLEIIKDEAFMQGLTLFEFIKNNLDRYPKFVSLIKGLEFIQDKIESKSFIKHFDNFLENIGYYEMYKLETNRIEQVKELLELFEDHLEQEENIVDAISELRQNISLQSSQDVNVEEDEVTLMTAHSSKGTEFEVIFVVNFRDGSFPHFMTNDIEEERRLAYVSITRAKKHLHLSYSTKYENSTPQFISEAKLLPKNYNLNEIELDISVSVPQGFKHEKNKQVGDYVFHVAFGFGEIVKIFDETIAVNFEDHGRKELAKDHPSIYIRKNDN